MQPITTESLERAPGVDADLGEDPRIIFSTFANKNTTSGKVRTFPWSAICKVFAEPKDHPNIESLPLIKFGDLPGGSRAAGTVPRSLSAVVGDYDAGEVSVDEAVRRVREAGIMATIYTTRRHTPERPRWRVVAPLSEPVPLADYPALMDHLNGIMGGILAPESWETERCYFYGKVKGVEYRTESICTGLLLDIKLLVFGPTWEPVGPTKAKIETPKAPASSTRTDEADFFDRVNDLALERRDDWVPILFPDARQSGDTWRISSESLGRDLEEDLSISAKGVKDFGIYDQGDERAGKRTPIYLVMEWAPRIFDDPLDAPNSPKEAALWLCEQMAVEPADLGWMKAEELKAATFDAILAQVKAGSAEGADNAAKLCGDMLPRIAKAGLTSVQEELLLKALKDATGVRLATLRGELHKAKRRTDDEDAEEGETHAFYAKRLLLDLAADAGGQAPVGVEGQIYLVGADSVWRGRYAEDYEVQVGEKFSGRPNCTRRGDYTGIAKHAYAIAAHGNAEFFADAPTGMACPDGTFYRVTPDGRLVVEPLTPAHRQRFVVSTTPADVPTPMFDQFLAQTFASDIPGECEVQIDLMQELVGASAMGLMAKHEKAVLLYGPGRAGKGTALKIIEELVPKEWRTAVSPFRWNSEYYIASLAGKRLNVVGELPEDMPIPAADFKTVTGRDLLAGRDPGGRPFTFRSEAAHIFNSNYLINTRDHSEAFFSRWIIVVFRNSRLGAGDAAIDGDLAKRIIEQELPGILWWALQGALRLVARGHFLTTRSHAEVMAKWRVRTDSVLEFLHDAEACEIGHRDDGATPTRRTEFYERYVGWCNDANRKPMGKQRVFETLESPHVLALGLRVRRDAELREVVDGLRLLPLVLDF